MKIYIPMMTGTATRKIIMFGGQDKMAKPEIPMRKEREKFLLGTILPKADIRGKIIIAAAMQNLTNPRKITLRMKKKPTSVGK